MVSLLLTHSWKKFTRSFSFSKDAATMIFTGLMGLLMSFYAIALGYSLDLIIINGLKQSNSIHFLNGLLLYYFGFEFILRYLMQNLPVLDIQPYLHLPMKKSNMVHYLLIRSLFHLINLLIFFLFAPFAFKVIAHEFDAATALLWLLFVWLTSLSLHFIILVFKKRLDDSWVGIIVLSLVFLFFGAADYYQWFRISMISAWLFNAVLAYPYMVILAFGTVCLLYLLNYKHYLYNIYPEEIGIQASSTLKKQQDISFLRNFGLTGEMINLEVKLILRSKRPRSVIYLSAIFLFYGLIFYGNNRYTEAMPGFLLFLGIFITGIFMMNYGQLLFSWQSNHHDFTLTRPLSMREYIEAKYWLLSGVTILCFIVTVPYVFFGWKILLINLAMTLFNIGVNVFVVSNIAMWAPKRIDLKKGMLMNYEGVGIAQWVMSIPVILLPYLIYLPFSFAGFPNMGVAAVGLAGLLGLILRDKLLAFTTKRFSKLKYSIAGSFRKEQ